jgi:hypothetical protein
MVGGAPSVSSPSSAPPIAAPSAAATGLATAAAPQATEEVRRPDPGLARGRWESPAWAFWVVLAFAVAGGLAWLAVVLWRRRAR